MASSILSNRFIDAGIWFLNSIEFEDNKILTTPALTAITHPRKKLGLKAIEILMNMDNDNQNRNYLVNPEIIERGSVCKLKKNWSLIRFFNNFFLINMQ